jgi:hypothetical protein
MRLDMNKIEKGLRAARQGKVAAGSGYFEAVRLAAEVEARFRVPPSGEAADGNKTSAGDRPRRKAEEPD